MTWPWTSGHPHRHSIKGGQPLSLQGGVVGALAGDDGGQGVGQEVGKPHDSDN